MSGQASESHSGYRDSLAGAPLAALPALPLSPSCHVKAPLLSIPPLPCPLRTLPLYLSIPRLSLLPPCPHACAHRPSPPAGGGDVQVRTQAEPPPRALRGAAALPVAAPFRESEAGKGAPSGAGRPGSSNGAGGSSAAGARAGQLALPFPVVPHPLAGAGSPGGARGKGQPGKGGSVLDTLGAGAAPVEAGGAGGPPEGGRGHPGEHAADWELAWPSQMALQSQWRAFFNSLRHFTAR
jgi:hypothetical protein